MNASSTTSAVPLGRPLAALWAARDISSVANWAILVSLLAWTYQGEEKAALLSILLLGQMLPPFLLGPLAPLAVSDRNARAVAVAAPIVRAAALFPLLGVGSEADLPVVLTAVLLAAVPVAFGRSAQERLLRATVPPGRLGAAERAFSVTSFLALTVGAATGSAVYGMAGLQGSTVVALAGLVASAALLLLARPSTATPVEARPTIRASLAGLQRGLIFCLSDPSLQAVAGIRLSMALVAGGLVVAQVAFMVWGLTRTPDNIGIILAAQGLGTLVGTAAYGLGRDRFPSSTLVSTGVGLAASAQFGFAISGSLNAATLFAFAMGLGAGTSTVALTSLVAMRAPEEMRHPSSRGLDLAAEAATLLSVIATGPLADSITPRFTILISGIVLAVASLYAFGAVADQEAPASESAGPDVERSLP